MAVYARISARTHPPSRAKNSLRGTTASPIVTAAEGAPSAYPLSTKSQIPAKNEVRTAPAVSGVGRGRRVWGMVGGSYRLTLMLS